MLQNLRTSTWFLSGALLGLSLAIGHSVYALKDEDKQIPFEDDCGPEISTTLLPGNFGRFTAALSKATETPPALAAISVR